MSIISMLSILSSFLFISLCFFVLENKNYDSQIQTLKEKNISLMGDIKILEAKSNLLDNSLKIQEIAISTKIDTLSTALNTHPILDFFYSPIGFFVIGSAIACFIYIINSHGVVQTTAEIIVKNNTQNSKTITEGIVETISNLLIDEKGVLATRFLNLETKLTGFESSVLTKMENNTTQLLTSIDSSKIDSTFIGSGPSLLDIGSSSDILSGNSSGSSTSLDCTLFEYDKISYSDYLCEDSVNYLIEFTYLNDLFILILSVIFFILFLIKID